MEGKLYDEIYTYLGSHFIPGEELPADVVVKRILSGGYVPQRYGYQNMREMFADLRSMLTVKHAPDGKMSVIIKKRDAVEDYFKGTALPKTAPKRGSGEIGLLSGMSLEEESPRRSKALPENYRERLPENNAIPAPKMPAPAEKEPQAPRLSSFSGYHTEPQTLPLEVKQKIYAAVVMGLQLEKPLYMSTLSPVLRFAGVEHDKLGFLKSKNMLRRCEDFMDFEEVMMNGVPQTLVTVHRVPEWDALLPEPQAVKKSSTRLDEAEKKRIYDLLCEHMEFETPLHMAAFSPILRTYGFDYRSYGFQKVKELAAELSAFLSLQEVMMNGVPQTLVTLHPMDENEKPQPVKTQVPEEDTARLLQRIAFLPPKILSVLSRMTGTAVWACEQALSESYQSALATGQLVTEEKFISRKGVMSEKEEKTVRFPLNLKTMRGDSLIAELHETGTPEGKPWFLAWVGSPSFGKEESASSDGKPERVLTPVLSDCCAISDSVVRAAAFKAVHASEADTRRMIVEDYADAFAQGSVTAHGEEYSYALKQPNAAGKEIRVLIAPNRIGEKPFYIRFVGVNLTFGEKPAQEEKPVEAPAVKETVRLDNAPLPKELSELCYLPTSVMSLLAQRCGMLPDALEVCLAESYRTAKEERTIARRPEEIRFPVNITTLKGEQITAILTPSMGEKQHWFLQHFDTAIKPEVLKEEDPFPALGALEQFAFMGDRSGQIHHLAQIAAPERWNFDQSSKVDNLWYYLDGAFVRIMAQDKLIYNAAKDVCIFHTGLTGRYGHDIYAQFSANLPGSKLPWRFERFVMGKIDPQFVGMPLPPSYFDSRFIPWFETDRNVHQPSRELIAENIEKLPIELLRRNSGALEISLIEQMKFDAATTAGCYARLKQCYAENPAQLELMAEALSRSISYAMHRAKRDYLYAVAGYLPQSDTPVWLLPVHLQRSGGPDIVVAYAVEYGAYTPAALLSVKEAYLAARFVRKLEGFWLQPGQEEKEM